MIAGPCGRRPCDFERRIEYDAGVKRSTVEAILRALNEARVRYLMPRAPVPLEQFAEPDRRERWVAEKGLTVFSIYSSATPETEIDLFVRSPLDFERAYSSALRLEFAPGVSGTFLRRDDLIAIKSHAGRPKNLVDITELQMAWEDAQGA